MTCELGWSDLNEAGKLKVAELYGYKTAQEFMDNENYGLYPTFYLDLDDDCDCECDCCDCDCDCDCDCNDDGGLTDYEQ
jgi:hypothetical protein